MVVCLDPRSLKERRCLAVRLTRACLAEPLQQQRHNTGFGTGFGSQNATVGGTSLFGASQNKVRSPSCYRMYTFIHKGESNF